MTVIAPITADHVITVAASQLGVHEDPPRSNRQPYGAWYGMNGEPWCAMFVSWVLHHAGWDTFAISTRNGYAYCPAGVDWFKQHGAWADKNVRPKRGWIVFFDFPGDGVNRVSHTGLVEGVLADGRIATIEGNTNAAGGRTGGEVIRHNRSVSGGIVGYGAIEYATASVPAPTPAQPTNPKDDDMNLIKITDGPDAGKIFLVNGDCRRYIDTQTELDQFVGLLGSPKTLGNAAWQNVVELTALDAPGLRSIPPAQYTALVAEVLAGVMKDDGPLHQWIETVGNQVTHAQAELDYIVSKAGYPPFPG